MLIWEAKQTAYISRATASNVSGFFLRTEDSNHRSSEESQKLLQKTETIDFHKRFWSPKMNR
jgi:hypothetical protein